MLAGSLSFGIPALVIVLFALRALDHLRRRCGRSGPRLAAVYADELTAVFYGTKRIELDHRDSTSMMREEQAQGAPPRVRVDLDRGTATVRNSSAPPER